MRNGFVISSYCSNYRAASDCSMAAVRAATGYALAGCFTQ